MLTHPPRNYLGYLKGAGIAFFVSTFFALIGLPEPATAVIFAAMGCFLLLLAGILGWTL